MNTYLKKSKLTLCIFLLAINLASFAQSPSGTLGMWTMFFNQTRLTDKWSIHSEVQYRSFEIIPNTEQLLLRAGVNYHIDKTAFASIGYAFVGGYAFDKEQSEGIQTSENRIWQQFLMRNNLGRCFFEHRYRLEQRWIHSNNDTKYHNRIRYLFRVSVPLNKKEIEKNAVFLSFYDELFIKLLSSPFDRNRLYGAVGYQFLTLANIQLGYLAQTVGTTTKPYIQAALTYNLDFRKKE